LNFLGLKMLFSLFLLSLFQQSTHGSPMQPRAANSAVIKTNFMDPSVIELNGGYYAFAGANGNPAGINIQVASSPDFSSWTLKSGYDALPVLGAWAANPGHVWSPDINQLVHTLKRLHGLPASY
jgi:arabinan endo-1,5-alpha-L-arabinosidase